MPATNKLNTLIADLKRRYPELDPQQLMNAVKVEWMKLKGKRAPRAQAGGAKNPLRGCHMNAGTGRCNIGFAENDDNCQLNTAGTRCVRNDGFKFTGPRPLPKPRTAKQLAASKRNIQKAIAAKGAYDQAKAFGRIQYAGARYAGTDCHINANKRCINGGPNDATNCARNKETGRCNRTTAAKQSHPIRATPKQLANLAYGRNVRSTGGLAKIGDVFQTGGVKGNCGINPATNYCKAGLGPSEFCMQGAKRCQKVKGSNAPKGTRNPTQKYANQLGWMEL
jgi:hypothetical protein